MLKQPRYLLSDPDQAPARVSMHRALRPMLVLGRHLCLSFQLDARGVPWRQTSAFVALQGKRQAPYSAVAGAFVRQGDVVHVWAWPAALQSSALALIGSDVDALRVDVVPETLLGPVIEAGALFRPCVVGVEGLRFERGALVASTWWPQPPEQEARAEWAGTAFITDEPQQAMQRAAAGRLWSRRWRALTPPQQTTAADGAFAGMARHAVLLTGLASLCASVAMAGFAYREQQLLQSALETTQEAVDAAVARRSAQGAAPVAVVAAPAQADYWQQAQTATRALQLDRIWEGLARSFGDSGYVLRDFSYERDEVRLTLVSAYGGALDLEATVVMLEKSGLWSRIDILDFSNATALRLGAKPRDALFAALSP